MKCSVFILQSPSKPSPFQKKFSTIICFFLINLLFLSFNSLVFASGKAVTPEELNAAFKAYQEAAGKRFSPESMVALYQLPNAAAAVKKLVDLGQSNKNMSISAEHSQLMEDTRQLMNMRILEKIAKITGGSVEVLNFGKKNGIRSDKDQTVSAVDGKKHYPGDEVVSLYKKHFREMWKIDMDKMDMALFDGDANAPDWRDPHMSFQQFRQKYVEGEAKLSQNPEAYKGGACRAQVDRRSATQGRVTMVKYMGESPNGEEKYERLVDLPAAEASSKYQNWVADVPYRNSMNSCHQNLGRFRHSADFIDKMKYFNRTVGDGINTLALMNWDVDYIFHLKDLAKQGKHGEVDSFIRNIVNDVYTVDLSDADKDHFYRVIRISAQVEIDKMLGQTKTQDEYLKRLLPLVEKEAARGKAGESKTLTPEEKVKRASALFFDFQERVMKYNLIATARQKIQKDFTKKRLQMVVGKYGKAQAQKLQWDTAMQIKRIFNELGDDVMIKRIISDAPPEVQVALRHLHELAVARRTKGGKIQLATSDPEEAKKLGPEEKLALRKASSEIEEKEKKSTSILETLKNKYAAFDTDLRAGKYSDPEITKMLEQQVFDSLGFEDRAVLKGMQVEFEQRFSGNKLLSNVVSLGNVQSVVNIIRVFQETGDWHQVAQTAVWELVSNVPGVSQVATLKQAINDGDHRGLTWMFIAWQLPAAGQAKLVFDIAKGSVEIFYHHLMDPLSNDRFDQVYMGYIEKQPAGWSPWQPGWKEREEAAADSILSFVPGETFAEKRSNLYPFFQGKLDQRLRANGLTPTMPEYWVKRDVVLPAFFQRYVADYFEGRGEWPQHHKITPGLTGMGQEEELKKRLVQKLLNEFTAGEPLYEKAQEVKEKALDALRRQQVILKRNIQIEKRVAGAQDYLVANIDSAHSKAIGGTEKPQTKSVEFYVSAYPSTIWEGQEVTFEVQATNPGQGNAQELFHAAEFQLISSTPLIHKELLSLERLVEVTGDPDFVKPLVQEVKGLGEGMYVTRLTYEVTVKQASGSVLGKKTVAVNLIGLDPLTVECPIPAGAVHFQGKDIELYRDKNGRSVGPWISYYPGGAGRMNKQECYDENGKKHGRETWWDEKGQKRSETFYSHGILHGTSTLWYEDGKKKEEKSYNQGKLDGVHTEWYSNGKKQRETHYQNDLREGLRAYWEDDGTKTLEEYYKADKPYGIHKSWDKATKELSYETHYENGKIMKAIQWQKGYKFSEELFQNGEKIQITVWFKNGQKSRVERYKDGKKHGEFTSWLEKGQVSSIEHYENGIRHGIHKFFHSDGKLCAEREYSYGKIIRSKEAGRCF